MVTTPDELRPAIARAFDRRGTSSPKPGILGGGLVLSLRRERPLQRIINMTIRRLSRLDEEEEYREVARTLASLRRTLRKHGASDHENPTWYVHTLEDCMDFALGRNDRALRHSLASLKFARTSEEAGISYANLSDNLRILGDATSATRAALQALDIAPTDEGYWAYLALARSAAADYESAGHILERIPELTDLSSPRSVWRRYLSSYPEFRVIVDRCDAPPAVRELVEHGNSRGGSTR